MSDAVDRVKKMFGGAESVAPERVVATEQPSAAEAEQTTEPMTQLNVRMPVKIKRRVRLLAARDNITISEVILRAIDYYEQAHGRAPEV